MSRKDFYFGEIWRGGGVSFDGYDPVPYIIRCKAGTVYGGTIGKSSPSRSRSRSEEGEGRKGKGGLKYDGNSSGNYILKRLPLTSSAAEAANKPTSPDTVALVDPSVE